VDSGSEGTSAAAAVTSRGIVSKTYGAYRRLSLVIADEGALWTGPRLFVLLVLFIVGLLAEAPVDRVGDAGEYMAMAHAFATGHSPALSPRELAVTANFLNSLGPGWTNLPLSNPLLLNAAHGQNFAHFWMYSLLAAPGVWIADLIGIHPNYAFAVLNVSLYLLAAMLAYRRIGLAAATFMFVSPVIWWWDKAHTEEFTFSLVSIALLLLEERPWWSMLALGLAATQNPPIALAVVVLLVAVVARDRSRMRDRRVWIGFAGAIALAATHPIFYETQLGVLTPQQKLGLVTLHLPTLAILLAPVTDLNIGLLFRFPMYGVAIVVVIGTIISRRWRDLLTIEHAAAVVIGFIFLFSFSQTAQIQSGGTPAVDRYALWLIPILIPFMRTAYRRARVLLTGVLIPVVLVSIILSLHTYAPARPEQYVVPTGLASWVWQHEPNWDNPLPVIFYEREAHSVAAIAPVGTPTCSKVLLVAGHSPANCAVRPSPPRACDVASALCYANRSGRSYEFMLWTGPDGEPA
jgi:hypothetical protein